MSGTTQALIDFTLGTKFDDLPDQVTRTAKRIVLDAIGCALGGYAVDRGKIAAEFADQFGGKCEAHIIGSHKTSCSGAAFVNGELINALDYEPIGPLSGHVSCYVVAPSMAVGERARVSGKDLITALAIAHEIGGRVASSIAQHRLPKDDPPYYEESPRFSYTSTIFGAIAGASKLLKLNSAQMANAFGIGGASTLVPAGVKWEHNDGPHSMTKYNCWSGWLSLLATSAALLAEKGFTGDTTILDGEWGFWKIYGSPFFKEENIKSQLGREWHVGMMEFKPYPACRLNHGAIDGINKIMQENEIAPSKIDKILVKGDPFFLTPNRIGTEVRSFADTQFRSSYIFAVAALYGKKPSPFWQIPSTFNDPAVRNLMNKVTVEPHASAGEFISSQVKKGGLTISWRVTVEITAGGRKFVTEIPEPRGGQANPLSEDELRDKFRNNAYYSMLSTNKIEQSIQMLSHLEDIGDISELLSTLAIRNS